jgi:hypothetical protein
VTRRLIQLLAVLATGACVEFIAPEGPSGNQSALLQVAVRVVRDPAVACTTPCQSPGELRLGGPATADSVLVRVDGSLDPGTDPAGETRVVSDDSVRLLGVVVPAGDTIVAGARPFVAWWTRSGAQPPPDLVLVGPRVEGVSLPQPLVSWGLPWTDLPDTLHMQAGSDLPLRVTPAAAAPVPAPAYSGWSLDLRGAGRFTLGADGPPPDTLTVPARFLPPPQDGVITAVLTIYQGVTEQSVNQDYTAVIGVSVDLTWVVLVDTASAGGGAP